MGDATDRREAVVVGEHRLGDRTTAARVGELHRHEVVFEQLVVLLERERREEPLRARPQLEVVEALRAVTRLERTATRDQDRLDVVLEILLRTGSPFANVEHADRARPVVDRDVVGVVGARELIATGVTAAAGGDGERHAQDLRVIDRRVHERPRLREVERDRRVVAAARDVEVRLRRAVTVARRAAVLVEDRLDVALELREPRRVHRVRLERGRRESRRDRRRARPVAGLRGCGRLEAVLGRAVLEPGLEREVRVRVELEDRAARVEHFDVAKRRRVAARVRRIDAVLELQPRRLQRIRDLGCDALDQQQRLRIRAEARQHVATLLDVVERRDDDVAVGVERVDDVEVTGGELIGVVGVWLVAARRVARALLDQDRFDVLLVVRDTRRCGVAVTAAGPGPEHTCEGHEDTPGQVLHVEHLIAETKNRRVLRTRR